MRGIHLSHSLLKILHLIPSATTSPLLKNLETPHALPHSIITLRSSSSCQSQIFTTKMSLTIPTNLHTAVAKPKLSSQFAAKPRFSTILCSASSSDSSTSESSLKAFSAALALSSILLSAPVPPASADISGLTPCKDSQAFAKREKQEIKKLGASLKLYAPDSAPALAINATIEKTKRRFDNYGKQGLLCGADGLPHLIVNGDQRHWGEFITPGILFLYIAGWIGWVGRSYLIAIRGEKKPTQKEIIIDVPLASRLVWRGFIWPVAAYREYLKGELIDPLV